MKKFNAIIHLIIILGTIQNVIVLLLVINGIYDITSSDSWWNVYLITSVIVVPIMSIVHNLYLFLEEIKK